MHPLCNTSTFLPWLPPPLPPTCCTRLESPRSHTQSSCLLCCVLSGCWSRNPLQQENVVLPLTRLSTISICSFLGDHAAPCCNSSNVHHVLSLSVPGVSPVFNPPYGWWVSHYHRHREHALLTHNTDWCVGASVRENWREKGWFTSTVNFQPCAFWSFFMGIYNYCVITISIPVKLMININIFQIITNVFDKRINYKSSFCFVIKSI